MLASLRTTRDNDRGPIYMHRVLSALHAGNRRRLPVTLIFGRHDGRSGLYLRYPNRLRPLIEKQIQGEYPDVDLETRLSARALDVLTGERIWSSALHLRPDLFPILRYSQWEEGSTRTFSDPLAAILEALTPTKSDSLSGRIEIVIRPARRWRRSAAHRALRRLARSDMQANDRRAMRFARLATSRFRFVRFVGWLLALRRGRGQGPAAVHELTTAPGRSHHDHERALQAASGKLGDYLFEATVRCSVTAPRTAHREAREKLTELTGVLAATALPQWSSWSVGRVRWWQRPRTRGCLLSAEELATLFHPATATVAAAGMHLNQYRKPEPPERLPHASNEKEVLRLGRVVFREEHTPFGIRMEDRLRHVYVPGKTGMGKSSLLQSMIVADVHAGRGIGVIDPHGDLAERIVRSLPRRRWDDLVLFDPADVERPIAFNPLDCTGLDATQRVLRADALMSVFKKLYADSFQAAARMEDIFRNAFLALVEDPDATLLNLSDLLHNVPYRTWLANRLTNPIVREFWLERFPTWTKRYHSEAVAPVENKVRGLTSNPILQGIVGQRRSKMDLRRIMDEGKILVANLSKGNCGENVSSLLGSLLVTMIQQATMSRSDIPEEARRPFYLFVDEFQNVVTESFTAILSEARKYGLALTMANQFLGQIDQAGRTILPAIFGNVGTLISFAVGPEDAELIGQALGERVVPADLVHLPRYHAYVALMIDGKTSDPFLMATGKPPEPSLSPANRAALVARSAEKYNATNPATPDEKSRSLSAPNAAAV